MKLKTPYSDLLPPLSSEEFSALQADISKHGVLNPILVDEDGNILDGHHRYRIGSNAPTKTVKGLSEAEKLAFVFRANFARRNLSPEQKASAREQMKVVAEALRTENPKKWTQKAVAEALGVARSTVDHWFNRDGHTAPSSNASKPKPDARVKLSAEQKQEVVKQVKEGAGIPQVAADHGVSPKTILRTVRNPPATRKADKPSNTSSSGGTSISEIGQSTYEKLAEQEGLNAWADFCESVNKVSGYINSMRPPVKMPKNYEPVHTVAERLMRAATKLLEGFATTKPEED